MTSQEDDIIREYESEIRKRSGRRGSLVGLCLVKTSCTRKINDFQRACSQGLR